MPYIVLDFETFYENRKGPNGELPYSLRSMTPIEYILDPRWECIGCAIKHGEAGPVVWLSDPELSVYFSRLRAAQARGEKLVVVAHNALFDMCVLHFRYGVLPDLMVDTMGMSRAMLYAFTGEVNLEAIAEYLNLPRKGRMPNVANMRADQIKSSGLWGDYVAYAKQDVVACDAIFKHLSKSFPRGEYAVMDMVLRTAVEPMFQLDVNVLHEHSAIIAAQKATLLQRIGVDKTDLMSNDKFAVLLQQMGVTPPTKISPTTGQETWAFAKSDPAMIDLAEHHDPDVQALVAARVGHKSTLEETRTQRLINISQLQWPDGRPSGTVPIPLRYSGAHTHRLSGDWKLNAQNWTKAFVNPEGKKEVGRLRLAHRAPPGYKVIKADASQIEARFVAALAGQWDLVEAFRRGRDVYCDFGNENQLYDFEVTKRTEDARFVCKNAVLGLGFGVGAPKFTKETAAKSFTTLGRSIVLDQEFANEVVSAYRTRYPKVPEAWAFWKNMLPEMCRRNPGMKWGPVTVEKQAILLPNGLKLYYPQLHYDETRGKFGEWRCKYGKKHKKLYGAMVFENVVQALARCATMEAAARVQARMKLRHQIHDDLIYIVPDDMVEEGKHILVEEMSRAPSWMPEVPLAAEAGSGQSYGECK